MLMSISKFAFSGAHLIPKGVTDPTDADIHIAYESDTFITGKVYKQIPGADLAAPGDNYRFTIIREDEFANNPNYEVVLAVAGVHIDDYDLQKNLKDSELEWGEILINGNPMNTIIQIPNDKREPQSSKLIEIMSDKEVSNPNGPLMPPYIFNVTKEAKLGKWLTVNITNVRKDGSRTIDGTAPFGRFVVNRVGYHVWYKKIKYK